MTTLFNAVKQYDNKTETENGCAAYKSTLNACLDLFFNGSSCRADMMKGNHLVRNAYSENKELCLKLLFYLRDVRGGQGERSLFRNGLLEIASFDHKTIAKIVKFIPEYGRWDDVFALFGKYTDIDLAIEEIVQEQFTEDSYSIKNETPTVSLMWKWLPSENTSSASTVELAKKIRKNIFKMAPREYRKLLTKMRSVLRLVETDLSKKEYKNINYSNLPSKAAQKYKAAFIRNDCDRYNQYLDALAAAIENKTSDVKINASTLYPYEIVKPFVKNGYGKFTDEEIKLADATWKSQKDLFTGDSKDSNWLAVADVSGSMTCQDYMPMSAAVALAMYTSERNKGIFKDKFITFSEHPEFVSINPEWRLDKKIEHIMNSPWGFNTNLHAVFKLILNAAKRYNLPQSEMPDKVLIISDMQFDNVQSSYFNSITGEYAQADTKTIIEEIKSNYADSGYKMPKIIFWNVAGEYKGSVPALKDSDDVILYGGYTAAGFEQMMTGTSPEDFMLKILNTERYNKIKA